MNKFEYVAIFFSLILGLGLVHLLMGITSTIQHRKKIKLYWGHIIWTIVIFQYLLSVWWGLFGWSELEEWKFSVFLLLVIYSISVYLLPSIIMPLKVQDNFDFKAYFKENKTWFFGIMLVAAVLDIMDTWSKMALNVRTIPDGYWLYSSLLLVLILISLLSKNLKFAAYAGVIWVIIDLYYNITELASIGGHL